MQRKGQGRFLIGEGHTFWLWIWDTAAAVDMLTPQGTPLHYAAFCGLYDIVKVLPIEHSEDVNV